VVEDGEVVDEVPGLGVEARSVPRLASVDPPSTACMSVPAVATRG